MSYRVAFKQIVLDSILLAILAVSLTSFANAQTFTFSTVTTFTENEEGPNTPLILDSAGNFYQSGVGAVINLGSVFKVSKSGAITDLYFFGDSDNDGDFPSPLTRDSSGNLYGTSTGGANNDGLIFKVSPAGEFTNLHNFTAGEGGVQFSSYGLVLDSAGNLYGSGGENIFEFHKNGDLQVLYIFCSLKNCADGDTPNAPIRDTAGNLYDTTTYGGNTGCLGCQTGNGVIIKLNSSGVETVLHKFAGGTSDGLNPFNRLKQDNTYLYGITSFGGKHGAGVLFKMPKAGGAETILYNFCSSSNCKDGQNPSGQVVLDAAGNIYGIATGTNGNDLVWELTTAGKEIVVYAFAKNTGAGGLTIDSAGNLYGTYGTRSTLPSIFKLTVTK